MSSNIDFHCEKNSASYPLAVTFISKPQTVPVGTAPKVLVRNGEVREETGVTYILKFLVQNIMI